MDSLERRCLVITFLIAAALLAACSSESEQVPRVITQVIVATLTPTPTATPSPTPASTPTAIKAVSKDPYLPAYGPFPPIPIPNRPANINPLTGLVGNSSTLRRRPILVRIGNDEKVRTSGWQAGLASADLVFEELIDMVGNSFANTRYTAVFLSSDPPLIGPVRSGRLVNLQIAAMLDGALSHAGASNGTRWLFSQTPMINLDEYFNMPGYCYIKSHGFMGRLYTTGPRLREWLQKKGWEKAIPLFGFQFADASPVGAAAKVISISKSPWPKWNQVEWRFDASTNKYARFVTGVAQVDNSYPVTAKWANGADCIPTGAAKKTPIQVSNVVVLYAKHDKTNIVEDTNNAVSVYINLKGQGDAQIFRNGVVVRGKWQRQSEQEFFQFVDAGGTPIALQPGTTWFEIVPTGYSLDVK